MFTTTLDFYHFVQPHLFYGEIAHVSSPSRGIEQKTILAHHTAEATCWLRLGCAGAKTLHTAALSLIYLTAEYWGPI